MSEQRRGEDVAAVLHDDLMFYVPIPASRERGLGPPVFAYRDAVPMDLVALFAAVLIDQGDEASVLFVCEFVSHAHFIPFDLSNSSNS